MIIPESEARKILLFEPRELITEEKIRKKFNKAAKIAHPDRGGRKEDYEILKKARDIMLERYCVIEDTEEEFIEKAKLRTQKLNEENHNLRKSGITREKKLNMKLSAGMSEKFKQKMNVNEESMEDRIPKINKKVLQNIKQDDISELYKNVIRMRRERQNTDDKRIVEKKYTGIDSSDDLYFSEVEYVTIGDKKYAVPNGKSSSRHVNFDRDEFVRKSNDLGKDLGNL